jgi:hypothetical protein
MIYFVHQRQAQAAACSIGIKGLLSASRSDESAVGVFPYGLRPQPDDFAFSP